MMDQLDSVLSQLRNGYSPDGAARRRVRSALATSLAVGAVLGTANMKATAAAFGSATSAKSAGLGNFLFLGKVLTGLGATATLTVAGVEAVRNFEQSPRSETTVNRGTVASSPSLVHEEAANRASSNLEPAPQDRPREEAKAPAPVERKPEGAVRTRAPSVVRPPSSSVDEFRLLREASQDLRSGRVAEAQRKLQEHGRRFPNTPLADERRGLTVLASCSAGTTKRNRAEAAHFIEVAPTSPLTDSVRKRCIP